MVRILGLIIMGLNSGLTLSTRTAPRLPPKEMRRTFMSLPAKSPKYTRREVFIPIAATMAVAGTSLNASWISSIIAQERQAGAISAARSAAQYISTLSMEQKASAILPFEDKKRVEWHFIPMETRKGLPLRDMNESQRSAALNLMEKVLSPSGNQRALDIMAYEAILLELEGPAAAKRRDMTKFYFAIYGQPSETKAWGLSIEGHHLSLNFSFDGGVTVDSTPQFFGVNPATLKKGFTTPDVGHPGKNREFKVGTRLLAPEEDRAFDLLKSLDADQLKKAVYTTECPDDIQWAGEPQPQKGLKVGIPAKDLSKSQQAILMSVLDAFLANVTDEVIQQRSALIKAAGIDPIYFGWAGATEPSGQHFFRVEGPTFIAELCNFQQDPQGNLANHIHSIWRDMTGDFNLKLAVK